MSAENQASAEGDRQWNVPGSAHPERLFAEWLNDQRMKSVSEVFHDIVRRYREALDSKTQPKNTPDHLELFKEAGEWAEAMKRKITPDMIELLGWLTGAANAWAEKVEAQSPAPEDGHSPKCLKGMLEDDEGAKHPCTCGAKKPPTRGQLFTALNEVAELIGDCEEWAITEDPQVVVSMVKDYMAGVALATQSPAVGDDDARDAARYRVLTDDKRIEGFGVCAWRWNGRLLEPAYEYRRLLRCEVDEACDTAMQAKTVPPHPKQVAGVGCALCGRNEAGYYCTGDCGEHQGAESNVPVQGSGQ